MCISVQRAMHRVEVNARPYSDPRKEEERQREWESNEGRERVRRPEDRAAWKIKNEQTKTSGEFVIPPLFLTTANLLSLSFLTSVSLSFLKN